MHGLRLLQASFIALDPSEDMHQWTSRTAYPRTPGTIGLTLYWECILLLNCSKLPAGPSSHQRRDQLMLIAQVRLWEVHLCTTSYKQAALSRSPLERWETQHRAQSWCIQRTTCQLNKNMGCQEWSQELCRIYSKCMCKVVHWGNNLSLSQWWISFSSLHLCFMRILHCHEVKCFLALGHSV